VSGRGDDVARPRPWSFVFADRATARGWAELVRQAPANADRAWVAITSDPQRTDHRQHQLKGSLSTASHDGVSLPQWQCEVTGGGRVWYLVDVKARRIVMTHAGTRHPGATDRSRMR
jgi:hypothetical protein